MSKIDKIIKPIVNTVVSNVKPSAITKNAGVSSPIQSAVQSLAVDRFGKSAEHISIDEVRKFFPDDKIGGGNFRKEMYKVKLDLLLSSILHPSSFKIWLHSVDLSNPLKEFDYKQITDFMNMYNGKFAEVWKSEKDGMRNIEKLALFVRSLHHLKNPKQVAGKINKLEFFKNLQEEDWTTCIDGIINRPKEVISALMQYKYDSSDINNAVLEKSKFSIINDFVQAIKDFLNKQVIKNDIKTYRGEKDFGIFGNTRLSDGRTLKDAIEDATAKIESGKWGEEEINEFFRTYLLRKYVTQNRFMSTAIIEEDTQKYAKKVLWSLDIPQGTKASFIEGYNVERNSESEILVQAGARLLINDAIYDFKKHRWKIWAKVSTALEKTTQ